jgi:hypothetical protein
LDSNYARGLEDGVELCYAKVNSAKTIEEARASIEEIWGRVKSRKLWAIEKQISEMWGSQQQ